VAWERQAFPVWRRPWWLLAPISVGILLAGAVPVVMKGRSATIALVSPYLLEALAIVVGVAFAAARRRGAREEQELLLTPVPSQLLRTARLAVRALPVVATMIAVESGLLWGHARLGDAPMTAILLRMGLTYPFLALFILSVADRVAAATGDRQSVGRVTGLAAAAVVVALRCAMAFGLCALLFSDTVARELVVTRLIPQAADVRPLLLLLVVIPASLLIPDGPVRARLA
jgi:hypothetical protein